MSLLHLFFSGQGVEWIKYFQDLSLHTEGDIKKACQVGQAFIIFYSFCYKLAFCTRYVSINLPWSVKRIKYMPCDKLAMFKS